MQVEDVIIIGAGPAGIAAAIQLERYGLKPLIFEKSKTGGLLRNANLVENYPGFPDGITGLELVSLFEKQLSQFSPNIRYEEVVKLEYVNELFVCETAGGKHHAQIVLAATGTKPIRFDDVNIPESAGEKIFYEVLPLLNKIGKNVVIVGAGDAAFDYALSLGKNNKITIINRRKNSGCLPLLKTRVENIPEIDYFTEMVIAKINDYPPDKLILECAGPGGPLILKADFLIFAIGRVPQVDFIPDKLNCPIPGLESNGVLYFAGDVINGDYRQTSIAVGQGTMAAMKIFSKLREINR